MNLGQRTVWRRKSKPKACKLKGMIHNTPCLSAFPFTLQNKLTLGSVIQLISTRYGIPDNFTLIPWSTEYFILKPSLSFSMWRIQRNKADRYNWAIIFIKDDPRKWVNLYLQHSISRYFPCMLLDLAVHANTRVSFPSYINEINAN